MKTTCCKFWIPCFSHPMPARDVSPRIRKFFSKVCFLFRCHFMTDDSSSKLREFADVTANWCQNAWIEVIVISTTCCYHILLNVYWFALELFLLKLEKNFWNFFEVTLSYNLPNWGKECWPFQLHVALVLLSRIHHHSAWIASSNGELYCLAISYHASSSTERTSGSWSSQA